MELLQKLGNLFSLPTAADLEPEEEFLLVPSAPPSPRPMDTTWLDRFEQQDQTYRYFYAEPVYFVHLRYIYVNLDNAVEKVHREYFTPADKNRLSREEMLGILKKCSHTSSKEYRLLSLLQYNITLDPRHVDAFLANKVSSTFWRVIKHFDAVSFQSTIESFNDLNELIFVLYEKAPEDQKSGSNHTTSSSTNHNRTKRICIHTHRHTRRKRFKPFTPTEGEADHVVALL